MDGDGRGWLRPRAWVKGRHKNDFCLVPFIFFFAPSRFVAATLFERAGGQDCCPTDVEPHLTLLISDTHVAHSLTLVQVGDLVVKGEAAPSLNAGIFHTFALFVLLQVGGLVAKGVAAPSLKARRAVAKSAAATGNSIFKSISSFTSVGGLLLTRGPRWLAAESGDLQEGSK